MLSQLSVLLSVHLSEILLVMSVSWGRHCQQYSVRSVSWNTHCHNCNYPVSHNVSTVSSSVLPSVELSELSKSLGTNCHYCQYPGTHSVTYVWTNIITVSVIWKRLSQLSVTSVTLDTHCNNCQYYCQYWQYLETCSSTTWCKKYQCTGTHSVTSVCTTISTVSIIGQTLSQLSIQSVSCNIHSHNFQYCCQYCKHPMAHPFSTHGTSISIFSIRGHALVQLSAQLSLSILSVSWAQTVFTFSILGHTVTPLHVLMLVLSISWIIWHTLSVLSVFLSVLSVSLHML